MRPTCRNSCDTLECILGYQLIDLLADILGYYLHAYFGSYLLKLDFVVACFVASTIMWRLQYYLMESGVTISGNNVALMIIRVCNMLMMVL